MATGDEAHRAQEEGARDGRPFAVLCMYIIEIWKVWVPEKVWLEERSEIREGLARDEVDNIKFLQVAVDAAKKIRGEAGLLRCIINENRKGSPERCPSPSRRLHFGGGSGC